MPQRFLRPGIRTSPRWNAVSHQAARLYISILTQVDDYGRHDGRTSVLWSEAFAVWNEQNPQLAITPQETAGFCEQLAAAKLVLFYDVDGRRYLQLAQWEERPRGKSRWPAPPQEFDNIPQEFDSNPLRNPAESCLPSLSPSPSHRHKPSPAPYARTHSEVVQGLDANIPTKTEVIEYAKVQGIPEPSATSFFDHHEGNSLWVNQHGRLINWQVKLKAWAERDRTRPVRCLDPSGQEKRNGADTVVKGKELERAIERMKTIKATYGDHQTWAKEDVVEFAKQKARRDELRKQLGVVV